MTMDTISSLKNEKGNEKFQNFLDEGMKSAETKIDRKTGKISNYFELFLILTTFYLGEKMQKKGKVRTS